MGFFDWSTPNREVATAVQRAAAAARFPPASGRGPSTGVLYKVTDGNPTPFPGCLEFAQPDFEAAYAQKLRDDQQLGAEYVTFQVFLPPRYLNTGGMYRNDDAFLTLCADRIAMLQRVAHSLGMNCYIEVHPAARPLPSLPACPPGLTRAGSCPQTHIDRISEDLQAFNTIIDRCPVPFELNGDLSHYLYRGINQGEGLRRVLSLVGHTHQRMARQHGDLSADVDDPLADWEAKGVTYQAFEYSKPALAGGLSSRVIMGESGPIHLVKDALSLDASLVPLWKEMAAYADSQMGAAPPPTGPAGAVAAGGAAGGREPDAARLRDVEAWRQRIAAAHRAP